MIRFQLPSPSAKSWLFKAFMIGLACSSIILFGSHQAVGQTIKLKDIQGLMKQRKYKPAERLLVVYVKMNPNDFDAWDMLGVAYYQLGDISKSLRILKGNEHSTRDPSYNFLFQALGFAMLQENALASYYFKQAANHEQKSSYTRLATFELASWYYNRRKPIRARRWIGLYIDRYPQGRYTPLLKQVRKQLALGQFVGHLPHMRRPDITTAFFKQDPLSIFAFPHYWLLESGTIYAEKTGAQISNEQDYSYTPRDGLVLWALRLLTGIGFGPFKKNHFEINSGFTYHQIWNSTPERFGPFLSRPSFKYFPFRADLQTRHHHLYIKGQYSFPSYFSMGIQSSINMERMGSKLRGPDPWNVSENHLISWDFDLTPWFGIQFNPRHLLTPYLYVLRKVNIDDPNFSHQTMTNQYAPVSFGTLYSGDFPKLNLKVDLSGHYFRYLYNDPYLDNRELTLQGSFAYSFTSQVHSIFGGSYSRKKYIEPRLKVGQCSLRVKQGGQNNSQQPASQNRPQSIVKCPQSDQMFRLHIEGTFTFKDHYGLFIRALYTQNNSNVAEQSYRKMVYLAGITITFPNVSQTKRYTFLPTRKPVDVAEHL